MSIDSAFGFKTPQAQALSAIDSTKYPDTNKDFQQNVIRLNQFVDYIASYLQTMQKSIDQNTQDPIAQIQGVVSDLFVLLGGGELLYGIDLGDIQYLLPAIGALLGFDSSTPFPINLFNAAEHFLLGYVVPLNSFGTVIEGIVDGWAVALGISQDWIDALNAVLNAIDDLETSFESLLTDLEQMVQIMGPIDQIFAVLWHGVTTLLGGADLSTLGDLLDPLFHGVAPWIQELATGIDELVQIINSWAGGVRNVQAIINFSTLFTPFIDFLQGLFPLDSKVGESGTWDYITAWETLILNAILPRGFVAPLVADASSSAGLSGFVPLENLAMEAISIAIGGAQSLIDSILEVFGYAPGDGTEEDVAQIFSNIFDFIGNPAHFTEDIFNITTAIQNFITDLLHPTNMLAPMDPVTKLLNSLNIPGMDATKITSGIFGTPQIPNLDASKIVSGILSALQIPSLDASKIGSGIFAQSMVNITNIAASIVSGILGTGQIPGLDASKITSGIFAQSMVNITNIAAGIVSGTLNALQIPGLDATKIVSGIFGTTVIPNLDAAKIVSGIFGTGQIPGLDATKITSGQFAQAMVNITNIASSIVSGIFPAAQIGSLDASKITSGQFAQAMVNITNITSSIVSGIFPAAQIGSLDASKITSGQFLDTYLPGLGALRDAIYQSSYGGLTTGTSAAQSKAALQNVPGANIISAILAAIVPNLDATKITTGQFAQSMVNITNIAAGIVSGILGTGQIPSLDATKITSGQFLTALIPNLNASIINAGTFVATLIPGLDATKIVSGVMALLQIPNLPATQITSGTLSSASMVPTLDASKIVSGILGILQIPTSQMGVSNIGDLGTLNDSVTNALQGLSNIGYPFNAASNQLQGTSVVQSTGAMNSIYTNVINAIDKIQALLSQNTAANISGASVNVNFSAYPDGALPSMFTVTYFGTGTSLIGIKSGNAGWNPANTDGDRNANIVYNAAPTNTDYQIVRGTMAAPPSPIGSAASAPRIWVLARVDSFSNPQNFMWARAYCNGFLSYAADLGCTVAGVETVFLSAKQLTWSLDIAVYFGANANPRRYQAYSGTQLVFDYTEAGTTSKLGAGFRYWGCRNEIRKGSAGGETDGGSISSTSVTDNLPPNVLGSGATICRRNTASVNASAAGPVVVPNNLYDTLVSNSADITVNLTNGSFTITNEGWYTFEISQLIPTSLVNQNANLVLFQNSAVAKMGRFENVNTTNAAYVCQSIFANVYCKAGDVMQHGLRVSLSGVAWYTGEATGNYAYFSVALMNKSYA